MGFWIFMLCMNLLIPLVMIAFGAVFIKHPPGKINGIYGYRTARSMASQEAWDFAHVYMGRLWLKMGAVMGICVIPVMLPCVGKSDDTVGLWGGAVCLVECILLILPVIPTERALKKRFPS